MGWEQSELSARSVWYHNASNSRLRPISYQFGQVSLWTAFLSIWWSEIHGSTRHFPTKPGRLRSLFAPMVQSLSSTSCIREKLCGSIYKNTDSTWRRTLHSSYAMHAGFWFLPRRSYRNDTSLMLCGTIPTVRSKPLTSLSCRKEILSCFKDRLSSNFLRLALLFVWL